MVSGADLKIAQMDVFGRRFHDLAVTATTAADAVQISATAQELEGTGTWRAQGKGRLTARLKRLVIPAAETRLTELREKPAAPAKPPELPALDIVAETFQLGQKQLGRLELNAVHENRDWRIERLKITNPDSTLVADGVWQGWLSQPRTQVNVRFDVSDIGKTLTRWGYPEGVRRGVAKIEGTLHWTGSPAGIRLSDARRQSRHRCSARAVREARSGNRKAARHTVAAGAAAAYHARLPRHFQ